jgi:glycosyltransferase involved in cell wall biosynthesis
VVEKARAKGMTIHVMAAPVDTDSNHPGIDGSAFRAEHTPEGGALLVVVSRLVSHPKVLGIERAISAAGLLADRPVRLVIVGDGAERSQYEERAATVNRRAGRDVVRLVGVRRDPRAAYAAADVVLGMATSVLRGMAIGRPAIVLGREGASLPAQPANRALLDRARWFAPGPAGPPAELATQMASLLDAPAKAAELGDWGRQVVVEGRSTRAYTATLDREVYPATLEEGPSRARLARDVARCWSRWGVAVAMDAARRRRAAKVP